MHSHVNKFIETARKELKNEPSQMFLMMVSLGAPILRQIGMSSFPDIAAAESYSRAIRADAIARLPELLEEFEKNAESKGAKVLWAKNAAEANNIILDIANSGGVSYVMKGKSMITEEIGLNEHLIKNGVEVFETDLGEVITQNLNLHPFHLVGPAINVPLEKISETFLKKGIIKKASTDPVELGGGARKYLRDKFRNLQMGIVGVNMAVAETGTIINVENEGNIRLIKSSPKTLVAIMSLEKVVPTIKDAIFMTRMLTRNCTGQKITSYVSMDTGPKKPDEQDGPEELFIIILDNGRSEIYRDFKTREILKCIRCGACLNTCPVYTKIGGYPYGATYCGPVGQVLTPMLMGIENTTDLYRACTLCGMCKQICPAGIDHPSLLLSYRSRQIDIKKQKGEKTMQSRGENAMASLISLGMSHGWLWNFGLKITRPLMNSLAKDGYIGSIPMGAQGWFGCRDLRAIPAKTFHETWNDLPSLPELSGNTSKKEDS